MLTFRQLDDLPTAVVEIIGDTERTIVADLARRIAQMAQVSSSSDYQIKRLEEVGTARDFIVRELSSALGKSEAAMQGILDEAATRTLAYDDKIYRAAGYSPIPLSENPVMQQIIWSGLNKTNGTFRNLTKTTAQTATLLFEDALDIAHMQIVTGGMDYKTAVRNGIRILSQKGIPVIVYPTGHVDYLDVAFRRAALTGANQTAAKLQEQRMREMNCTIVETSSHAGARSDGSQGPSDHAHWQGKRYRYNP